MSCGRATNACTGNEPQPLDGSCCEVDRLCPEKSGHLCSEYANACALPPCSQEGRCCQDALVEDGEAASSGRVIALSHVCAGPTRQDVHSAVEAGSSSKAATVACESSSTAVLIDAIESSSPLKANALCLSVEVPTATDTIAAMKDTISANKEKHRTEATTEMPTTFPSFLFDIPEEIVVVKRSALRPIPAVTASGGDKASAAADGSFPQKPTGVQEQVETSESPRRISLEEQSVQIEHRAETAKDPHRQAMHSSSEKKRPSEAPSSEFRPKKTTALDQSSTRAQQAPSRALFPAFDRLLTPSNVSFKSTQHADVPDRLYRLQYTPFIETRYPSRSRTSP